MVVPDAVTAWCVEEGCGEVISARPLGGGCINQAAVIKTEGGSSFFLKTNRSSPPDMFLREAEGLRALTVEKGPRIPGVFLVKEQLILLEDLQPASRSETYWTDFGVQLAQLHLHTHPEFGFHHPNYIGSTPQVNTWEEDGFEFFGEHRLLYQARRAREKGLFSRDRVNQVEKLASRLDELIPRQPASLIHGDLWSGNAITDQGGNPAIIDPAAYYGWAEAELAMTDLFGSYPAAFYQAYQEIRPLDPGYRERFPLYNLYHLINHVNLFGRGYLSRVHSILDRYLA